MEEGYILQWWRMKVVHGGLVDGYDGERVAMVEVVCDEKLEAVVVEGGEDDGGWLMVDERVVEVKVVSDEEMQLSFGGCGGLVGNGVYGGLTQKTQHKAIFLANEEAEMSHVVTNDYNIELVHLNDMEKQNSINDNNIDFVFTFDFLASIKFIERTLKSGGVVIVLMNDNPSAAFHKPENYKIIYMRRFNALAIAMKKTSKDNINYNNINNIPTYAAPRKLMRYNSEVKKAALQQLENVLLEPPRATSRKSRKYLKRTRYLPDLMGDSLESYSRHVFIDVGLPEEDGGSRTDWFLKNYPTRNKNFEIYKIDTVTEDSSGKEVSQIGISDWVRKSVTEEEYVVMKAEAEVVEEMIESNSIGLIDELFLECKPKQGNKGDSRNRRAYWECLALYGKLRDKGVAVHQWWG
ncbi:hypothetical protein RJT34_16800 [Clitoria ternatea]|uniref:DUF7870 domain-containing protein n=1 Tax=Clitoria ternatea TaxID=43366 RepID=A0AAN9J924_CLITE